MSTGAVTKRAKIPVTVTDVTPDATQSQELRDRIEQRAYEIYKTRGGEPGHEVGDWLQAEREVLGESIDSDLG